MGRTGGSCTIDGKSGEKSKGKATKEMGAEDRHAKKMKSRAADAKKQAAATKGSEVKDA